MSSPAEECRQQLEYLRGKLKEARQQLKVETDLKEKERLKNRIRGCNQGIANIKEQLKFFDPEFKTATRTSKSQMKQRINTQTIVGDFFERNKEVWSDLEGRTWQQIEQAQRELNDTTINGYKYLDLQKVLAEGCSKMTKKQTIYVNEYYNNGLSMEAIAEQYGVTRSTVCRCIKQGLIRIQDWADARLSVNDFVNEEGQFDWKPYLEKNNKIISDRQRELLLLVLTGQAKTKLEISQKLNLHQSTVVRTLALASKTVKNLELKGQDHVPISIQDWEKADVFSIALQLNMPLNFYYKYCFDRNKRYKGLTRYVFEVTKRVRAGKTSKQISEEFGISEKTAKGLISVIKRKKYTDKVNEFSKTNSNVLELLADDVYVKLQNYIVQYERSKIL